MYKDTVAGMNKGNTLRLWTKWTEKHKKDGLTNVAWSQSQAGTTNFMKTMYAWRRVTQDYSKFSDAKYK